MIKIDLSKIEATYTREVELKPDHHVRFYGVLLLIAILIFVVFGIRPTLISYAQDSALRSQLKQINNSMEQKLKDLKTAEEDMRITQDNIDLLYNKLPKSNDLQNFLKEFVFASSKSGFITDKLRISSIDQDSFLISITLKGSVANLPYLIKDVENLERINNIDEIETLSAEDEMFTRLKIKIYFTQ